MAVAALLSAAVRLAVAVASGLLPVALVRREPGGEGMDRASAQRAARRDTREENRRH